MSTDQTGIEGINDFLKTLPEQQLRRLYETPSNCLAVFRLIPPYARYLVLVLLWLEEALTVAQLEVLHRKAEGKRYGHALVEAIGDW
jgi:transcription initiation factor TFIIH subunit 4